MVALRVSFLNLVLPVLLFFLWIFDALLLNQASLVYYLLMLLGVYLYFRCNRLERPPHFVVTWVRLGIILFIYVLISALVFNGLSAIFGYRFEVFRELIWFPFVLIAIWSFSWNPQLLFRLVIMVALYSLFYDIAIVIEKPARGVGVLETPISRGNMGMLWGVLSLIAFFGVDKGKWKFLAIIGFFSGVLLSFLSGSRGGWGALIISFILLLFYMKKYNKRYFWFLIGVFFVLVLSVFLFWNELPIEARLKQTLFNIQAYFSGNPHSSIGYRFEMWRASWMAFLEKPLFGWGFGNFDLFFIKYMHEGLVVGKPTGWGHAHNDFLLVLSEMGVVGFMLFFGFFVYPFIQVFSVIKKALYENNHVILMVGMLGTMLTESVFEFALSDQTFTVKYFMFTYITLYLAIFAILFKRREFL